MKRNDLVTSRQREADPSILKHHSGAERLTARNSYRLGTNRLRLTRDGHLGSVSKGYQMKGSNLVENARKFCRFRPRKPAMSKRFQMGQFRACPTSRLRARLRRAREIIGGAPEEKPQVIPPLWPNQQNSVNQPTFRVQM